MGVLLQWLIRGLREEASGLSRRRQWGPAPPATTTATTAVVARGLARMWMQCSHHPRSSHAQRGEGTRRGAREMNAGPSSAASATLRWLPWKSFGMGMVVVVVAAGVAAAVAAATAAAAAAAAAAATMSVAVATAVGAERVVVMALASGMATGLAPLRHPCRPRRPPRRASQLRQGEI